MLKENKIINGLWIGDKLSNLELLTLKSFVRFGHLFYLWLYEPLKNDLPEGVIIQDANQIIPKGRIYRRKYNDPECGIGKGSIGSPFSDWFRYKLLYEKGGWWVDMDITCLKPFDIHQDFFFREHNRIPVVGNVMKVPPKTKLMERVIREVEDSCSEDTVDWLLPNKILSKHILEHNLYEFITKGNSNDDNWIETKKMIMRNYSKKTDWYYIHWMNENWRTIGIDKNNIRKNSFLGKLMIENDIIPQRKGLLNIFNYKW